MNRLPKKTWFSLLAAGSIILFSSLSGCHSSEGKEEREKKTDEAKAAVESAVEGPAAVETFALQRGKLASALHIPGELVAYRDVDIYARVTSYIKKLNVDVGSEVKQGQLLAQAEAPELNAQLASAESKLKAQEALSIASRANYARVAEAAKNLPGAVSKNDIDQALARQNADQAQLAAAKSAYREVADLRQYLQIRAPFDGIISARNASTGAYIGPAGKGSEFPLFVLTEQRRLRLVISVPEAYTGYVNTNDKITFNVRAFPDRNFNGEVKRAAGALDKKLRAERVEVDVVNNDRKLLPGMIAEVNVPLPTSNNALIVPKSAIINSTTGVFVIRVNQQKAEWVPIKRGLEADEKVEIFGSLKEGDKLVTEATEEIRDGSPVSVK
jgi:RND family efflux transporter MFP subunit